MGQRERGEPEETRPLDLRQLIQRVPVGGVAKNHTHTHPNNGRKQLQTPTEPGKHDATP